MLLFLYGSHHLIVVRSEWLPLVVATLLIVGGLLSEYLLYSVSVLFFAVDTRPVPASVNLALENR